MPHPPRAASRDQVFQYQLQLLTCPICQVEYGVDHKVVQLPDCKHIFGEVCIHEWLDHANTCPLCRQVLFSRSSSVHSTESVASRTESQASSSSVTTSEYAEDIGSEDVNAAGEGHSFQSNPRHEHAISADVRRRSTRIAEQRKTRPLTGAQINAFARALWLSTGILAEESASARVPGVRRAASVRENDLRLAVRSAFPRSYITDTLEDELLLIAHNMVSRQRDDGSTSPGHWFDKVKTAVRMTDAWKWTGT
ncbi:hypothetical protein K491DRAFT_674450 [Lophiostoma macrostomum CBS 122681]|uniref:RING-type domain-containing protein n=1 Tax=Lophiostoma macrostomum CBS 122681 TaxID=1314788 RepID=A0A6A6TL99_9PLEO|nr:hypothetical protein K491DRAFT_674450 [Lophiostoma macrostomum CBS 122681]